MTYRESAIRLGKTLETMGEVNPYPYYIAVVEVFEHKYTTGDFGDFNDNEYIERTSAYYHQEYFDRYSSALNLSKTVYDKYFNFIQIHDLKTIARFHGIVLEQ